MLAQQQVDKHLNISPPKATVTVQFGSQNVTFGNVINQENSRHPPTQISWPCRNDGLYTLMLVDLDSPSKKLPEDRELRLWVVANIPANDISQGTVLTEYEAPCPMAGTGFHRYPFLVYEQADVIEHEKLGDRTGWKANEFARKHNMKLVAGNYFQTKVD